MFRFILPIIFVLASVGLFLGFTKEKWDAVKNIRSEVIEYKKALDNSKKLLSKRDALLETKNSITEEDLKKLDTLLPNDLNSTKLILEIENLASNIHGLEFENPKYNPDSKDSKDEKPTTPGDAAKVSQDYGIFDLEFTLNGPYDRFITFMEDLEKSLRLVNIQDIEIQSQDGETFSYIIKLQTYWLKS
jgi:Tfp pilus assembly protein PilO